jgi:hypoxanthine phosphoribosyltransferase
MTLDAYDNHHVGHGHGREEPVYIEEATEYFSPGDFLVPAHYADQLSTIIIPRGMIEDRIEKMAWDIYNCYKGDNEPVHLICVLKGSRGFFQELITVLNRIFRFTEGHEHPPFLEYYVRVKKVEMANRETKMFIMTDDLTPLMGKHVLVVDDLVATGLTISRFCQQLFSMKPKSLRIAVLLEKRTDALKDKPKFKADFSGFSVPDHFFVGAYLDRNEHYRDLEHIAILKSDS